MIVAHRGASRDAPENTIPAFKLAWEQGADAIEGDFHLTKDGHIVCIHDDNTKRVSNTNLVVRNVTLSELRQLDVGIRHSEAFKGTVIPTIAEVFATIPRQKAICIEIKCGAEIMAPLIEAITISGLTKEQIVVLGFNKDVLKRLKDNIPQCKAYWLCGFEKNRTGKITPSLEMVVDTLKWIRADGLFSNSAIPASIIEAIDKQGYEWHVWTIDDPMAAKRMKALGAKSIITNVPGFMRSQLGELAASADATKPRR